MSRGRGNDSLWSPLVLGHRAGHGLEDSALPSLSGLQTRHRPQSRPDLLLVVLGLSRQPSSLGHPGVGGKGAAMRSCSCRNLGSVWRPGFLHWPCSCIQLVSRVPCAIPEPIPLPASTVVPTLRFVRNSWITFPAPAHAPYSLSPTRHPDLPVQNTGQISSDSPG